MYDITRELYSGFPVWPGDTPFTYELTWKMSEGSSVNVGKLFGTTHLGTHLDAPYHYDPQGATLEQIPLEMLMGPCLLVDASSQPTLDTDWIASLPQLPMRVLFFTGQPNRWAVFPEEFVAFTAQAALLLGQKGVKLVGTDAPSVDPLTSKTLSAHHAFNQAGIYLLEGLALEGVPSGSYELLALPLKVLGADAAPVRALLR